MTAVRYELKHVDTDLHAPFKLSRKRPIVPALIIPVGNTTRVNQSLMVGTRHPAVVIDAHPEYPRVILRGDWT